MEKAEYYVEHIGSAGSYRVLRKEDDVQVGTGKVSKTGRGDFKVEYFPADDGEAPDPAFVRCGQGESQLAEMAELYCRRPKR